MIQIAKNNALLVLKFYSYVNFSADEKRMVDLLYQHLQNNRDRCANLEQVPLKSAWHINMHLSLFWSTFNSNDMERIQSITYEDEDHKMMSLWSILHKAAQYSRAPYFTWLAPQTVFCEVSPDISNIYSPFTKLILTLPKITMARA